MTVSAKKWPEEAWMLSRSTAILRFTITVDYSNYFHDFMRFLLIWHAAKTLLNHPDLSFNSKTTSCFASRIKWKTSFKWEVLVWTAQCVWMFTLCGRIVSLLRFVVFSWNTIRAPPVGSWLCRLFYGTSLFSLIWETFRSLIFVTITLCGVCRTCGYGCFVSRLLDVTSQSDL